MEVGEKFIANSTYLGPEMTAESLKELSRSFQEGLRPTEGEIEKTAEELLWINFANHIIKQEIEALGLSSSLSLEPERVHLFSEDDITNLKGGDGYHSPVTKGLFVRKKANRVFYYRTLFHESVHFFGYHNYHGEKDKVWLKQYRQGFFVRQPKKSRHEHFRGLNEAVVELITSDLLNQHQVEVTAKFKFRSEELQAYRTRPLQPYDSYVELLAFIIYGIAKSRNVEPQKIWSFLKRGYFNGSMLSFPLVDKVYGRGSLRVLGELGTSFGKEDIDVSETVHEFDKIASYFKSRQP